MRIRDAQGFGPRARAAKYRYIAPRDVRQVGDERNQLLVRLASFGRRCESDHKAARIDAQHSTTRPAGMRENLYSQGIGSYPHPLRMRPIRQIETLPRLGPASAAKPVE